MSKNKELSFGSIGGLIQLVQLNWDISMVSTHCVINVDCQSVSWLLDCDTFTISVFSLFN